jgi:hypothetical protein
LLPARPAVLQAKRSFAGVAASSCVVPREIPSCLSFFTRGIIDQDRTVISDRIGRLRTRGIGDLIPRGTLSTILYLNAILKKKTCARNKENATIIPRVLIPIPHSVILISPKNVEIDPNDLRQHPFPSFSPKITIVEN